MMEDYETFSFFVTTETTHTRWYTLAKTTITTPSSSNTHYTIFHPLLIPGLNVRLNIIIVRIQILSDIWLIRGYCDFESLSV